jgi:hypothetical protein
VRSSPSSASHWSICSASEHPATAAGSPTLGDSFSIFLVLLDVAISLMRTLLPQRISLAQMPIRFASVVRQLGRVSNGRARTGAATSAPVGRILAAF